MWVARCTTERQPNGDGYATYPCCKPPHTSPPTPAPTPCVRTPCQLPPSSSGVCPGGYVPQQSGAGTYNCVFNGNCCPPE